MCAAALKLSKMSLLSFSPNSFHIKKKKKKKACLPAMPSWMCERKLFPGWSFQRFETGDSHETVDSIIPVREHTKEKPLECKFDISVPGPRTHIRCNDSIKSVTTTLPPINDETGLHLPRWKQPDLWEDQKCFRHAVKKEWDCDGVTEQRCVMVLGLLSLEGMWPFPAVMASSQHFIENTPSCFENDYWRGGPEVQW